LEELIHKYLSNTLTDEESLQLEALLENPENRQIFKDYVRLDHDLTFWASEKDQNKTLQNVWSQIKPQSPTKERRLLSWYQIAASVLLFVATGIGIYQITSEGEFPIEEEEITLEFEDGSIEIIELDEDREILDEEGNTLVQQIRNRISYLNSKEESETQSYNTLKVPYGKKFEVELSDGTLAFLNSGSSITFPVRFTGDSREVTLSGEGYFDVTSNKEKPFIVNVGELNVEVLGTEFNISSYPEDEDIEVVLVEGSVKLYEDVNPRPILLSPNWKGSFDKEGDEQIKVETVNTQLYISWMQDRLTFRNTSFENLIIKMEREYNVDIELEDTSLSKKMVNATFDHEGIDEILGYFKEIYNIEYQIKNDKILIHQSN
jgi:hypothetical protein